MSKEFGVGALRTRSVGEWYSTPHFQNFEFRSNKFTNALTSVTKDNMIVEKEMKDVNSMADLDGMEYKIRKLTEREAFRIMDVSSDDIDKIQSYPFVIPEGKTYKEWRESLTEEEETKLKKEGIKHQYKLAGNSIVVRCLEKIFTNLFEE